MALDIPPLFADTDMDQQEQQLLAALALVMERLHQPEALPPILEYLDAHHLAYTRAPGSFEIASDTLRETLRLLLSNHWTPELQAAWTASYGATITLLLDDAANDAAD